MQVFRSLDEIKLEQAFLTIGSFDGVHLGHQEIINTLVSTAHQSNVPAVVLTFFPHPGIVLKKRSDIYYLNSPDERAELLGELGVDVVIIQSFNDEFAQFSARNFIQKVKQSIGLRYLVVGHDFALGHNRDGDLNLLKKLGDDFEYSLRIMLPVQFDGEVVSSSRIRNLLIQGDVVLARRLLGRPFSFHGEVVHGDGRGKTLGIPTANLTPWENQALPREGVYASQVEISGRTWGAVTNVGVRPTFEALPVPPRVETHILGFQESLYGKTIKVSFIERLRDEIRFNSVNALVEQIKVDIMHTQQIINN
jgi:riboflavin kinase/FMN adenylyltransferase